MAASTTLAPRGGQSFMDLNILSQNVPSPPPGLVTGSNSRDRDSQLTRRIRELEEELRVAHAENDKQVSNHFELPWALTPLTSPQKLMINKFRERWEKLKESAKRKRNAKLVAHSETSSVHERIEEEPEAEEAAAEEQSVPNQEDLV